MTEEEDSYETYRREFLERKAAERKEEKAEKLRSRQMEFKIFRWLSYPIFVIAVFFVIDYWLPSEVYKEKAEMGWQEGRGSRRNRIVMSFMKTQNFTFDAPNQVHINYEYLSEQPGWIYVEATPFLKIVKSVETVIRGEQWTWEPEQTIYTNVPYLPYLIAFGAIISLVRKKYSEINYGISIFPIFLMGLAILIWFFAS